MTHIFLDPDGSIGLGTGLLVVVQAPTGVIYRQACAGYMTDERDIEGFIIPVGDHDAAKKIYDWFWRTFKGNCYPSPHVTLWTPDNTSALAALISEIPCWLISGDRSSSDKREFLRLDETKMDECVEAWIPVITPYGNGILTLHNSD